MVYLGENGVRGIDGVSTIMSEMGKKITTFLKQESSTSLGAVVQVFVKSL